MRMGHGVRDDSDKTCIHFVTTGYLVRLVAHHPEVSLVYE
jgi:HrpA-like RNA helicase